MESITIGFDEDRNGTVHVSVMDYNINMVDPRIMIQALYDLAKGEERSYRLFCVKKEMEKDLQKRRN